MLQDIAPHIFHGEYRQIPPRPQDSVIAGRGRALLLREPLPGSDPAQSPFPTISDLEQLGIRAQETAFYLFSVDDERYFCLDTASDDTSSEHWAEDAFLSGPFRFQDVMKLRELEHSSYAFVGAVGHQLFSWYAENRYCGACGSRTEHSETERALCCPKCGLTRYPAIAPVVIIAILDGERILLTRYNRSGYRRHALVAGFVEAGETLEAAIRREVMEEVGLKVKNIRYCESQPWPFSSSLIAGFFADVDGDPTIRLNTDGGEELSEGVWVDRRDVEIEDSSVSLTWDMIRKFRDGKEPR